MIYNFTIPFWFDIISKGLEGVVSFIERLLQNTLMKMQAEKNGEYMMTKAVGHYQTMLSYFPKGYPERAVALTRATIDDILEELENEGGML